MDLASQIADAIILTTQRENFKPVSVVVAVKSAKSMVRKTMDGSEPVDVSLMQNIVNIMQGKNE
jgi:hypothetical protein